MEREQADGLIEMLLTAFSAQKSIQGMPKETIDLYTAFMTYLPFEAGKMAIMKLITNNNFFPTIAEIKEAVNSFAQTDNTLPSPEDAWEEVRKNLDIYHAPKWSCPAIEKAVKVMGYRNLCVSQYPGHDREQFMKIYGAYRQREQDRVENESIREMTALVIKQLPGGVTA